jgi:hypothetical protein
MPPGYIPGSYLNMAVKVIDVAGQATIFPALAQRTLDSPQSYYGILRNDLPTPVVTVRRGSVTTPLVEGAIPLIPDKDVYLSSTTAGYVTQATPQSADTVMLRIGFALDAARVILSGDFRADYY